MDDEILRELAELEAALARVAAAKVDDTRWKGKPYYRCSCGVESRELRVVKQHEWNGHTYQLFNQKSWMGKVL